MKRRVRLTESDLHRIVKESVRRALNEQHIIRVQYDKELSHSRGRKYFYCSDNGRYYTNIDGEWLICTDNYNLEPDCHLENDVKVVVESVNNIVKKMANESIENETRFLPYLKRTYENLYREYEHWQYSASKPQGMDDAIDAIIEAMHCVKDIIKGIEPSDDIPIWEDPQQY